MEQLSYKLDVFEGPLDVLLTLIAKNKLNIYDIPIAQLLDQYMEQIRLMQAENMDIASEFLEMAARLVYMKSVSLLPKREEEEEELKRELTGQLLEYRLCKEIAKNLSTMVTFDKLVRAEAAIPADFTYRREHQPQELVRAYLSAVGRGKRFLPPPRESFSGIVARKFVSVSSQIASLLRRLRKKSEIAFSALFSGKKDRSERVAAFLAVLELVKEKRVRIHGEGAETKVKLINGGVPSGTERDIGEL